jgi:predicted nucleic acid-binding Zn ribbon protein
MYCSACGTQLPPGLSFCNRCGMSLKERERSNAGPIAAFLSAITIIGVVGMGIMLGGTAVLTTEAHLKEELVGFFMLFIFLFVALTEILLIRQLSRFTGAKQTKAIEVSQQLPAPGEPRAIQAPRSLVESMPSVTENTTRTLQYSRDEPAR